jgi:hypothetical protein
MQYSPAMSRAPRLTLSPGLRFLEAAVEAFVPVPAAGVPIGVHRRAISVAALFAREQIDALAPELRWSLVMGLAGFRCAVALRYLRRFDALPLAARQRVVAAWAFGSIPLARQLFRPLRTTALIAYYEYAAEARAQQ